MDRDVDQTLHVRTPGARSEPVPRNRPDGGRFVNPWPEADTARELDWLEPSGATRERPSHEQPEYERPELKEPHVLTLGDESDQIREGTRTDAALRRDSRVRRALAVADVLAVVVAFGAALAVEGQAPRVTAILALPLVVVFMKLGRL